MENHQKVKEITRGLCLILWILGISIGLMACNGSQAPLATKLTKEKVAEKKQEVLAAKDIYLTVGAKDCDFPTIKQALTAVDEKHKIIFIMDEIHTEDNIKIDKDVTIQGFGSKLTTVQAATKADLAKGRVFFIEEGATVRLEGLTIRHGKIVDVPRTGAGILNNGDLTIEDCDIRNNLATYGVGIDNRGNLLMQNSMIAENHGVRRPQEDQTNAVDCGGSGAGMKVQADSKVHLINCLIIDNVSVANGGGIHVACEGYAILENCTIARNTAELQGGGISVRGDLELIHCTISENYSKGSPGSGLFAMGKVNMVANIIAGNKNGDFAIGKGYGYYGKGIIEKNKYNFIGDGKYESFLSGDPLLLPLADYGGNHMTYGLKKESPAIDAIPNNLSFVEKDQRGMLRSGGSSDIGAYEYKKATWKDFMKNIGL